MVQLISDPTVSHLGGASTPDAKDGHRSHDAAGQSGEGRIMSREEHAQHVKELMQKRGLKRAPRRGWTMTEYQGDTNTPQPPTPGTAAYFERQITIPEHAALPSSAIPTPAPSTPSVSQVARQQQSPADLPTTQLPQRPKLPPPRRSYSVMDYEPEPRNQPKPSSKMTLLDLPSELHYLFCDYLDPIDSVCFGLAHSRLYAIHRRKYGTVPLSSRYSGPNDMEWAWRGAGPLVKSSVPAPPSTTAIDGADLTSMRTRGQVYCRKCGISRCELHRHLKEWMGEGVEYCEIKEMYGQPAENTKPYCYMSSPKNPHRCGRHGGKGGAKA